MLFTRCPDCETTFRITDTALRKANGQVRCGRCACVFDAYAQLRAEGAGTASGTGESVDEATDAAAKDRGQAEDSPAAATRPKTADGAPSRAHGSPAAAGERAEGTPVAAPVATSTTPAPVRAPARESQAPVGSPPAAATGTSKGRAVSVIGAIRPAAAEPDGDGSFDGLSVADVVEQLESGAVADDAEAPPPATADGGTIDDAQVQQVLEAGAAARSGSAWTLVDEVERPRSRLWTYGSVAAAAALALQVVNHYRSEIAGTTLLGPPLRSAYAFFGIDVVPHWDLEQYEIVDWIATAEPSPRGQGSLVVSAQIRNKGPHAQPYPLIHVELKDRFEAAIGSRIFDPAEYSAKPLARGALLPPGATARAQLEVVDPGPDAYGFELDVCIGGEQRSLRCSTDEVFRSK